MKDYIETRIKEHLSVFDKMISDSALVKQITAGANACVASYQAGGRIFFCGNGGSAADSQHLAAELVSRFYLERPGLAAEALSTNTSSLTAIGNDYEYNRIFARQLEANGRAGDVLFGISTSGNSQNIVAAFKSAKEKGIITIGFTGNFEGMAMEEYANIMIKIPSTVTPRVQEAHIFVGHLICEYIEETLFPESRK